MNSYCLEEFYYYEFGETSKLCRLKSIEILFLSDSNFLLNGSLLYLKIKLVSFYY